MSEENNKIDNRSIIIICAAILGFIILVSSFGTNIAILDTSNETDPLNVIITDPNNKTREAIFDDLFKIPVYIDIEHHEIHEGDHFFLCDFRSLGNGASSDFLFKTFNGSKWVHLTFQISGTQGTSFIVYEDSNTNLDGINITIYNNNRNSDNPSSTIIQNNPTINTIGTMIYEQSIGANKEGGNIDRNRELILKQNTEYIFRLTNQATNTNVVNYCAEWYEHTNS